MADDAAGRRHLTDRRYFGVCFFRKACTRLIDSFGRNMFGGDFVFSVSRDFVRNCRTPLLLQPGTDKAHPAKTSEEITALAPNLEIQKDWRAPAYLKESIKRVHAFLKKNVPK